LSQTASYDVASNVGVEKGGSREEKGERREGREERGWRREGRRERGEGRGERGEGKEKRGATPPYLLQKRCPRGRFGSAEFRALPGCSPVRVRRRLKRVATRERGGTVPGARGRGRGGVARDIPAPRAGQRCRWQQ
jgi:hypothetical protein